MTVIEINQHPSNTADRKRIGRGIAAGQGKTAGRGHKGAGSRSGNFIKPRFEGGQQPLVRHLPKLGGFKHHRKVYYHAVNLRDLSEAEAGTTIDLLYLESKSLLPKKLRGMAVKLLADGGIDKKLHFKLHAFSHKAKEAVEKAGGSCEVI